MKRNSDALKIKVASLEQANCDLDSRLGLLSSLLDNLPGMAFRCLNDKDLTFEYASKGSQDILGYPPSKIVSGYAFRQLVHPEDQIHNTHVVATLTVANKKYNLVYRIRAAWGEDRWVHEQGTGIFSKDGELIGIDGLLTDITDQKVKEIQLHEENARLRSSIKDRYRLGSLIGKSGPMQKVYELILRASSSSASVVIHGESGTGKEVAARTVHELSGRADKPFVAVNCGAISESLAESEFFGHVKGAFSGAFADRDGFLSAADGGTLFLDEIGEMPISMQIKLLRVLDGKSFIPVGSNKQCSSDFRLISATNRDLGEMVKSGRMREDFYYRINTVPVSLPPLRHRKDDLPLLIDHFVNVFSDEIDGNPELSRQFYLTLDKHNWPGNVRELQSVIRRFLTLKEISFNPSVQSSTQGQDSRPDTIVDDQVEAVTVRNELDELEKQRILSVLNANHWHIGKSASSLGMSRRTLQRRLNKYQLK